MDTEHGPDPSTDLCFSFGAHFPKILGGDFPISGARIGRGSGAGSAAGIGTRIGRRSKRGAGRGAERAGSAAGIGAVSGAGMERSGELSGKRKAANSGTHADSAFEKRSKSGFTCGFCS